MVLMDFSIHLKFRSTHFLTQKIPQKHRKPSIEVLVSTKTRYNLEIKSMEPIVTLHISDDFPTNTQQAQPLSFFLFVTQFTNRFASVCILELLPVVLKIDYLLCLV